eukprot:5232890-Prymnesium_polylepis.1
MARAEVRAVRSVSPGSPRASSRMAVITGKMRRKLDTTVRKREKGWGEGAAAVPRPLGDVRTSGCGSVRSRGPGLRVA